MKRFASPAAVAFSGSCTWRASAKLPPLQCRFFAVAAPAAGCNTFMNQQLNLSFDMQQRRRYCTKPPGEEEGSSKQLKEEDEKIVRNQSGEDKKEEDVAPTNTEDQKPDTTASVNAEEANKEAAAVGSSSDESSSSEIALDERNKPGSVYYDPDPFVKGVTKVKWKPLELIEEVPKPKRVLTDIEILMTAWSEEQAKYFFVFTWMVRGFIFMILIFLVWFGTRMNRSLKSTLRGTDNMPSGLRIGNVVYLDFEIGGVEAGRVTIGLFNEDCPIYTEYFHRMCTGSGGNGDSFRGCPYVSNSRIAMSFGHGIDMKHGIKGFNEMWLPTEKESNGPWRGAVSSLCYTREKQSPNFQIHLHGSKDTPQIFGMVLSGMETLERIYRLPTTYAGSPQTDVVVGGCGELCTLDKSQLTPLPWSLYQGISAGYDAVKYGKAAKRPRSMAEDIIAA